MRILQVINSLDAADGGPAELALQLCSSLSAGGDACELMVTRPVAAPVQARLGRTPVHCVGPAVGRYSYSSGARRWLDEHVARFDAVVIHGVWQHCAASAAAVAFARRVPYFVYPHGTLDAGLPAIYPIRHLKKVAYWHLVARSFMERAAGVCFTSEEERERATAFPGHWNPVVIGGGIEAPSAVREQDIEALLSRFPALRDHRVALYMGRLVPLKGVDMLIRAFSRVRAVAPGCRLLIAGEGTGGYERRLAAQARACGCDDTVVFAGALAGAEKWAAFRIAELFALPSHRDSFGVAVVEALASATPVLVTRAVGIAPIVQRCGAGFVCSDDEGDLARTLERALSAPTTPAMRAAARRCYEENFSARETGARLKASISRAREGAAPIS
jgi:glycosyltransferase involved in cell wall biosynthesis